MFSELRIHPHLIDVCWKEKKMFHRFLEFNFQFYRKKKNSQSRDRWRKALIVEFCDKTKSFLSKNECSTLAQLFAAKKAFKKVWKQKGRKKLFIKIKFSRNQALKKAWAESKSNFKAFLQFNSTIKAFVFCFQRSQKLFLSIYVIISRTKTKSFKSFIIKTVIRRWCKHKNET